MSFTDLQGFLRDLESAGELRRVETEVDPYLEVSEIAQRVVRRGGPALLFTRVRGSRMPLAINVFGTEKRMAMALGANSLDEIGAGITELINLEMRPGVGALKDALGRLGKLRTVPPKKGRGKAACQEVVLHGDEVDLDLLPGIQTWPGDGGVFLNMGLTTTKHPETGARNVGMYRLQKFDKRTVGMHWQIHKDSTAHHAVAERRGERLPIAIFFGPHPAITYCGSAPLPGIDEFLLAGYLSGHRVELTDCLTVPLQVPANSQIVLEGWLEPGARRPEGPFGDHTGFYTPVEPFPALTIDTMTMRRDAVYQTIVVGPPPQEDGPMGKATERIFLPLIKMTTPDIVDLDLPEAGVFHNCAIVSIDKRYPKHAQKVMNSIWGAGLLSLSKLVVVVDADCDVHDYTEVAFRAFGNVDYSHDLVTTVGPVDHLDHASYQQFWGGKAGIDATRKLPEEGYQRGWPAECVMDPATSALVDNRWAEYGL